MHVRELIKGMDAIIPDGIFIQDFAIVTDTNNQTTKKILDIFIKMILENLMVTLYILSWVTK